MTTLHDIPLTIPRFQDPRADRLLVDLPSLRSESAPFLKHARNAPTVFLSIDPKAPMFAVFRHRAPDAVWPLSFRIASDVHGPALAHWLVEHEADFERLSRTVGMRRDLDTEMTLERLQRSAMLLETSIVRTPTEWLTSSLVAHDAYDLLTLDWKKAARIGVLGIGAVTAASTNADIEAIARKAVDSMKGVDIDQGTAFDEIVHIFSEIRVVLGGQDDATVARVSHSDDADDERTAEAPGW